MVEGGSRANRQGLVSRGYFLPLFDSFPVKFPNLF